MGWRCVWLRNKWLQRVQGYRSNSCCALVCLQQLAMAETRRALSCPKEGEVKTYRVKIMDESGCPAAIEVRVGDADSQREAELRVKELIVPGVEVVSVELGESDETEP